MSIDWRDVARERRATRGAVVVVAFGRAFRPLTKLVEGADRTIILAHTLDLAVRLLEEQDEHPNVMLLGGVVPGIASNVG